MYGIKLTQEDIDTNKLSEVVGTIKLVGDLPNVWNGINAFKYVENPSEFGFYHYEETIYDSSTHKLGDLIFEDDKFFKEIIELTPEKIEDIPTHNPIPITVKNMGFRLALINEGISIKSIDDAINALEEGVTKEKLLVMWNFAEYFDRDNQELISMAAIMGVTESQLDELFLNSI